METPIKQQEVPIAMEAVLGVEVIGKDESVSDGMPISQQLGLSLTVVS
jgi:hypothetical protein